MRYGPRRRWRSWRSRPTDRLRRLTPSGTGKKADMARSMHVLKTVAMVAVAVILAAACRKSNDNNSTAPATEPPTATPGIQAAGTFQLGGRVDHAFQGVGPPV